MDTINNNSGSKSDNNDSINSNDSNNANSVAEEIVSEIETALTEEPKSGLEQENKNNNSDKEVGSLDSILADIQKYIPEKDEALRMLEGWANENGDDIELYAMNPAFIPRAVAQYTRVIAVEAKLAELEKNVNDEVAKRTKETLKKIKNMNYSDLGVSAGRSNTELDDAGSATLKSIINRNI